MPWRLLKPSSRPSAKKNKIIRRLSGDIYAMKKFSLARLDVLSPGKAEFF
jgi:hypothetical protein